MSKSARSEIAEAFRPRLHCFGKRSYFEAISQIIRGDRLLVFSVDLISPKFFQDFLDLFDVDGIIGDIKCNRIDVCLVRLGCGCGNTH